MPQPNANRHHEREPRHRRAAVVVIGLLAAFVASCGSTATPTPIPTEGSSSILPPPSTPRPTPTQPPADAGWVVRLQSLQETPGRTGFTNIDATVWLLWQGPGATHVPAIAGSVTSVSASVSALQPTLSVVGDQIVPPGYAVTADIAGEHPANLKDPVLHVYSNVGTPFHEGIYHLDQAITPDSVPLLPPVTGGGTLDAAGQVTVTPSVLTVFHSLDGVSSIVAQHGDHVVQYGGDGDFWEIAVAVNVHNLGATDLSVDNLTFEMFDNTWAEDVPDIRVDPEQDAGTIPAGASVNLALTFDMPDQPVALRLVMAVDDPNGVPTSYGIAGFGATDVSAGDQMFQDLLTAVDTYQEACRAKNPSAPGIGTSQVDFAAATSATTAVVHATDAYVDASGAATGSSDDTYVLARGASTWAVTSMSSGSPEASPGC